MARSILTEEERRVRRRATQQKYYRAHRDERRAKGLQWARNWKAANRERQKAYMKAWRARNPDKVRAQKKRWNAAHASDNVRRVQRWNATHPGRQLVRSARWALNNPEKQRAASRRYAANYRVTNPDKVRLAKVRDRAKRKAALKQVAAFTVQEWKNLLDTTGHRCVCCGVAEAEALLHYKRGRVPVYGQLTKDHIIPLSKGGSNTIDNIQPLCLPCNTLKHRRDTSYVNRDNRHGTR